MGQITGVVATIRWAHFEAAAINGYTIARDEDTREWTITGNLVLVDRFKLSQRPLLLVVPHSRGKWVWPIRGTVPRCTGPFTVALGPPDRKASQCLSKSAGPNPSVLIYRPGIG